MNNLRIFYVVFLFCEFIFENRQYNWINFKFRLEAINEMFKIWILTVLLSVNFVIASRILPSFVPNGDFNF
jgi:hypothetical protein